MSQSEIDRIKASANPRLELLLTNFHNQLLANLRANAQSARPNTVNPKPNVDPEPEPDNPSSGSSGGEDLGFGLFD